MTRLSTIELFRESLKFSAGHFTIFSATEREHLHGHNYQVYAAITTLIGDNGLRFDYRYYNQRIEKICQRLNLNFLLPAHSKYLQIKETEKYYEATFNGEVIPFLKKDVLILPITNTTVEELSWWFLQELKSDEKELEDNAVQAITVKIASNPGRQGSCSWTKDEK